MIRLENIKKEGNVLSATVITVEMEPQTFKIAFDVVKNEIVENSLGKMTMSVGMAVSKLVNLANESGDKLPKKATSVWY